MTFSLAYGSEAAIPMKVTFPTLCSKLVDSPLRDPATLQPRLTGVREQAQIRPTAYQQQLSHYYN